MVCSSMVAAEGNVSANAAFTSDYVFRGISQSDNHFAVSAGADYAWELAPNGLYLGAWASSVDFDDGGEGTAELDFYLGFTRTFGDINFDLGLIYYEYPGANNSLDYDLDEAYVNLGYKFASLKYSYSDNYFAGTGNSHYWEAGVDFELVNKVNMGLHVGSMDVQKASNYNDWKVALSREIDGFGFEIAYTDTNLSKSECGGNWCDGRAMLTISKEL